ncbi:MAG TPA: hypothetical protein VFU46_07405 [Gemmatimonadales bacterium]|nr:hypothetical protein [Gemmatimonadales bacterium]
MYATIRRYAILNIEANPTAKTQLFEMIQQDFLPRLAEVAGFDGYFVLDTGPKEIATITLFETREGIEESTRLAAEAVARYTHLARVGPPEVTTGSVVMHRESSRLVGAR